MAIKKKINIHQAFYGYIGNGHGCLCSTIDDSHLKTHLTAFTDRPGSLPAGIKMKPYYSGMKYNNYYVFTLTFPDEDAPRAGMVFTHALILDSADLEHVNNLEHVFSLFCTKIPEEKASLTELSIDEFLLKNSGFPSVFPQYTVQSVHQLIKGSIPIVFCGNSNQFTNIIFSVWAGLPKSFRSKISFTAGFIVSDLDTTKTFIHFPEDLIDSLRNSDFISGRDSEEIAIESTIDKFVLSPQSDSQFDIFLSELNVDVSSWQSLYFSAKAFEGYILYPELNNDVFKQLLRLVAKISPDKKDGLDIKSKQIAALIEKIVNRSETNLKSLRNLPLDSFEGGEEKIGNAIKLAVENEFEIKENFNRSLIAEILLTVNNDTVQNWWHHQIIAALKHIISKHSDIATQNIWKTILESEEAFKVVWSQIPTTSAYEGLMIKYLPSEISGLFAEKLLSLAAERQWVILYANILLMELPLKEAFLKQYYFEKNIGHGLFQGTEMIGMKVSSSDLLSIILEYEEDFFISEYVRRTLKDETLLHALKIDNKLWLQIWNLTLEETGDLVYGITDAAEKIEFLLNGITEEKKVPELILRKIAESRYADISGLRNRAKIWKYLDPQIATMFLEATSNSVLKDISSLGLSAVELESELVDHIATDRFMTSFLNSYKDDINTVIEVYEHIPKLKDGFLSDYVKYYLHSLQDMQSERLGNLVRSKGYKHTAKEIFEKAKNNNSYRIALERCKDLLSLGFFDRLFHGHLFGEKITKDDVYSAITQICIELYPQGPEDRDLWQRASGDISKLYQNYSREENWRTAIKLLRNGGGGKNITTQSLLNAMIEDYPNNTQLKHLLKTIN